MKRDGGEGAQGGALPPGFTVGHWTHPDRRTGTTVIVPEARAISSAEVRGGAPASREVDLLAPWRTVDKVDALVLTGGSAFGLGTAHGVVEALAARGLGHPTSGGPVPIVPAAAIFDLPLAGRDDDGIPVHPPVWAGRSAYEAASERPEWGQVGVGCGATVGKVAGADFAQPGGVGAACLEIGPVRLGAVAAVNSLGDVTGPDGDVIAGCVADPRVPRRFDPERLTEAEPGVASPIENTTLVAVLTDATIDKVGAYRVAVAGHDGLGMAVRPAHTRFDGDSVFVLASGRADVEAPGAVTADVLAAAAAEVVSAAVRHAVSVNR